MGYIRTVWENIRKKLPEIFPSRKKQEVKEKVFFGA